MQKITNFSDLIKFVNSNNYIKFTIYFLTVLFVIALTEKIINLFKKNGNNSKGN